MRVLRYEDEEGYGPFCRSLTYNMAEAIGDDCYYNRLPEPYEEGLRLTPKHLCGCKDEAQLTVWFPEPAREILHEEGFALVVYEVPDEYVQVGKHQVVFEKVGANLPNQGEE